MRMLLRGGMGLALVAVGYVLGTTGVFESQPAHAQVQNGADNALEKDTQEKIKAAYEALIAAKEALVMEGRYQPITGQESVNAFAILSGGVNAVADLESGQGVDPETFAALYADLAAGDVRMHLDRDAQGRMTYRGKVIRMYPIARLKQVFAQREQLAGIEEK